jgi:Rrf2 family protein
MLKLNKKMEYGLIAIMHIASINDDEVASAREIADKYNIPVEVLGKVLQTLARRKILHSVQGIKGGYKLLLTLDDIKLGHVINALDGPVNLVPCLCGEHSCDQELNCNIKEPLFYFQEELKKFIYDVSLADFNLEFWRSQMTACLPDEVPQS